MAKIKIDFIGLLSVSKRIKNRLDYKIGHVNLFTPPEEDIKIIRQDFEVIKRKLKMEEHTNYQKQIRSI